MSTDTNQQDSSLDEALDDNLAAEPVESEETDAPETVEEILEALDAPQKWDKRYKEVFSGLAAVGDDGVPAYANGRDVQQTMLDMYNEGQSYTTRVEQERAEIKNQLGQFHGYANEWNNALAPYQQMIAESGATPHAFARQAFGMAQAIKNDPQTAILRLAQQAGVDLRGALDGQEWQSPESKQGEALAKRMDQWERGQQQQQINAQRQALFQQRQQNDHTIRTFAEAKDESGELLHPHLDAVQDQMAMFIRGSSPRQAPMELDQAYDMACKLNPDLVQAEKAKSEVTEATRKAAVAAKATKAGERVKQGKTNKEKPKLSLDQQLDSAFDSAA